MWKPLVFVVATVALLCVSRKSLAKPRSHGFYRFFAWELMAAAFLLNVQSWFLEPAAWHQIISWILLFLCIIPLAFGIHDLRSKGQPEQMGRQESELLAFERTTRLVTGGIYRYIRHPLYSSLFILNWGIFFKSPSWIVFVLALCTSLLLVATARADEAECIQTFGADYRQYMRNTRMFIPYII